MNRIAFNVAIPLIIASSMATADNNTILVLDGSGSMWGQIDQTHKIEIARDVIRDVLSETPEDYQLGLVAYGHNRKGDCGDIEALVPIGTDHSRILEAVDAINPKGKTPLSDAVVFAAEQLNYRNEPANVVLISDGIENCNADPCAVGESLEQAGIDFTAHVIGFDIVESETQEQLTCLAENTGGRYLSAANAAELVDALQETVVESVVQEQPPKLGMINLKATELDGGIEITSGLNWKIIAADSADIVFELQGTGSTQVDLKPGVYDVFVSRNETSQTGEKNLIELKSGSSVNVTIAFPLALTASVRTLPENHAPINSDITVFWEGPNRVGDYITIAKAGSAEGTYSKYKETSSGKAVTLRVPAETGEYEIRYMLGKPRRILATVALVATEVKAQLDAPESVAAGSKFDVEWMGPAQDNDWITVVKPDAKDSKYTDYAYPTSNVVRLQAELQAGEYEIRYVLAGKKVIARRPITVMEVSASLSSVDVGNAGDEIDVQWNGPGLKGDWITIVNPDAKDTASTSYFYAKTPNSGTGKIRLPLETGNYELRYVQGGKKVLARQAISVSAVTASLTSPPQITAGSELQVEWTGPDTRSDHIAIVAHGAPENKKARAIDYFYTSRGSPGSLVAPNEPGEYEIRYFQKGQKVLAKNVLIVNKATATLSAPADVAVNESFSVDWTGPDNNRDLVVIAQQGEKDTRYINYHYVRKGSPANLNAPSETGVYELRYLLNGRKTIHSKLINVVVE